jgi:DNA polymerase-1
MKILLLLDTNSLIHRFYHALPPLTTPKGEPVGSIYGLSQVLLKIFREIKPNYIAACYDRPEPTFRDELYKEYKAQRPKADEALVLQIIRTRELFSRFGVKNVELPGYEADDLIGTLAEKFKSEPDLQIVIFSGDLDNLQLVEGKKVVVDFLLRGITEVMRYDEPAVVAKYGLSPAQLPDLKAFVGDASDNIPGVAGVGPKTAQPLIKEFGTVEEVYNSLGIIPDKVLKKIANQKDTAVMSKKLATIVRDAPIQLKLEDLSVKPLDTKILKDYFMELGFRSLVDRISNF